MVMEDVDSAPPDVVSIGMNLIFQISHAECKDPCRKCTVL